MQFDNVNQIQLSMHSFLGRFPHKTETCKRFMFKKVVIEYLYMSRVPAIIPHSKQQNERMNEEEGARTMQPLSVMNSCRRPYLTSYCAAVSHIV